MNNRTTSQLVILLSFCVLVLCFSGGCLDTSTPVPIPEPGVSVSVSVPADGYGLFMSSTVGILLQPVIEGTKTGTFQYDWQCDNGQFLTWNAPDFIVTPHGTSLLQDKPTPVYWSPLGPDGDYIGEDKSSSPVTVTLEVYDSDRALVAEAAPVIITQRDDDLWYAD